MELRRLADYLTADEERFAELLAQMSNKQMEAEKRTVQGELFDEGCEPVEEEE